MWILILRRIAAMGFSILFLTALIFFLMQAVFGDPVVIMLGRDSDPDTVARLRQDLGLNRPAYVQYGDWLGRVAEGVMFGTLLIAALQDLWRSGRSSWRWAEMAAVVLATVLAGCWAVDELGLRPVPGPTVRATVFLAWLVAVTLPAMLLGRRLAHRGGEPLAWGWPRR